MTTTPHTGKIIATMNAIDQVLVPTRLMTIAEQKRLEIIFRAGTLGTGIILQNSRPTSAAPSAVMKYKSAYPAAMVRRDLGSKVQTITLASSIQI
jgi:hypothetical protein